MPAGGGSAPQRHLSRVEDTKLSTNKQHSLSRSGARASLKESKEEEKRVDDALQLYMLVAYEAADITSDIVHCFFLAFWMRGCSQATKRYLPQGIHGARLLFFVSARTNKRHHHHNDQLSIFARMSRYGYAKMVSSFSKRGSSMMIVLLLFLQKQSLAFAVYLFGIGTLHTGPGLKKKHM